MGNAERHEDLTYGNPEIYSAEQLETANKILERAPANDEPEVSPVVSPSPELSRAEKDAEVMTNLLEKKITATLSGDTEEADRLQKMIELLESRQQ